MKRTLLYLLLLFTALLFIGGVFLKKGVQVDVLQAGPAVLSNITLQWQTKLDLQIETIDLSLEDSRREKGALDLSFVDRIIPLFQWIDRLFSRLSVEKLRVGEIRGSFLYESSMGNLAFSSPLLKANATLKLQDNALIVDVSNLKSEPFNSHATGTLQLDLKEKSGVGQFAITFADSLPVIIDLSLDQRQLSFQGKENGTITTITPFVDLFGLPHNIQRWITDYLSGSRYELKTFRGHFPWENPLHLLESFYAEARVEGCEYAFATDLEPIKSEHADAVFEKGVLVITPHNATFYGQDTEDSWLDINFNYPSNTLLTAYILTNAKANQDIVNLLGSYDIPLPFKQTEGKTATDLTLTVNFYTDQVTAQGTFTIDEGRVDYEQNNYGVKKALIGLDDTVITFKQMEVSYADMFVADVTGVFDADTDTGDLDISIQEASFSIGNSLLKLDKGNTNPSFHYTIRPNNSTITGTASSWKLDVLSLRLGEVRTSFSFEEFAGELEPTMLSVSPGVSAKIWGNFSIQDQKIDLQADLLRYNVKNLQLVNSTGLLTVQYDKDLLIRSDKESKWLLNSVPIVLSPSEFTFSENISFINSGSIRYGKFFESSVSGQYNHESNMGTFQLEHLDIKNEKIGHVLTPGDIVSVQVDGTNGELSLKVPELAVEFSGEARNSWTLAFTDLSTTAKYSPLLQKNMVDAGSLKVVSRDDGCVYEFWADIPYRYALLVKDGQPVDHYTVQGQASGHGLTATVNDDIQLLFRDTLLISAKDVFFNLPGIIQLLKEYPEPTSELEDKKELQYTLDAVWGGVVLASDRVLLADRLLLEFQAGRVTASLEHDAGTLNVDVEGGSFSLVGEQLNDTFMAALASGADFQHGNMNVAAKGSFDEYSVLLEIKDTVLKDFNVLNNVLAMLNTIPALITFSLPSYSYRGLPVDTLVVGMSVKDGLATLNSMKLESPELSIAGVGWIDFTKDTIGMDLNLITQAKKNISKIPLLGFILAGREKKPSITVKVSGNLDDPHVVHSTFREVATLPFSMLFRTLALPAHLVTPIFSSGDGVGEDERDDGGVDGEPKKEAELIGSGD